jgi:hypothetical protein
MTTIERDEMDEWRAANPEAALAEAISVAIGCESGLFVVGHRAGGKSRPPGPAPRLKPTSLPGEGSDCAAL